MQCKTPACMLHVNLLSQIRLLPVTMRLSMSGPGREIFPSVFAYPNPPRASTGSCNVNPLKLPLCSHVI